MMNSIHAQIAQWRLEVDATKSHLVSFVFQWVTRNFKQHGSTGNKGSGPGDHDSAGQWMVSCHTLPSRIERRVATPSGVGKRCCRRLWLRKFLFSYGKFFCFPHVVSPHPHGPPWWGSLERNKGIGRAGKQTEGRER